jgi:hypothetical protein
MASVTYTNKTGAVLADDGAALQPDELYLMLQASMLGAVQHTSAK